MKTCPYCAEEIQDAAIVCKYCKKDLGPRVSVGRILGMLIFLGGFLCGLGAMTLKFYHRSGLPADLIETLDRVTNKYILGSEVAVVAGLLLVVLSGRKPVDQPPPSPQPKGKSRAKGCCVGGIVCFLLLVAFNAFILRRPEFEDPFTIAAREQGSEPSRLLECQANCKNLAEALEIYASDNGGRYPDYLKVLESGGGLRYPDYLKVLGSDGGGISIPHCPIDYSDYSYTSTQTPDTFKFNCQGDHSSQGLSRGFPMWDSKEGLKLKTEPSGTPAPGSWTRAMTKQLWNDESGQRREEWMKPHAPK